MGFDVTHLPGGQTGWERHWLSSIWHPQSSARILWHFPQHDPVYLYCMPSWALLSFFQLVLVVSTDSCSRYARHPCCCSNPRKGLTHGSCWWFNSGSALYWCYFATNFCQVSILSMFRHTVCRIFIWDHCLLDVLQFLVFKGRFFNGAAVNSTLQIPEEVVVFQFSCIWLVF